MRRVETKDTKAFEFPMKDWPVDDKKRLQVGQAMPREEWLGKPLN